jgi:predicted methyltransferase
MWLIGDPFGIAVGRITPIRGNCMLMSRTHARVALLACAATMLLGAAADDAALQAAVQSQARTPKYVRRDSMRHPAGELAFFGLQPAANVVEVWPGGGYWTEILAPYLAAHGTYVVALPADTGSEHDAATFRSKFVGKPGYGGLHIVTLDKGQDGLTPGSADFILTFRNVHNWMGGGYADEMFADFFRALKPGGILGVEEHRGLASEPQDPAAASGYVRQDYTVALAKKAGFALVGSSELNANPNDTKHWPKGVWTLPPTFEMGQVDHAKYAAIGEADNFILKFRKPAK